MRNGFGVVIGPVVLCAAGLSTPGWSQEADATLETILARERLALDRWAQGDPYGYLEIDAEEITYFDDIAAQQRIDGLEEMRGYFAALVGKIPPHRYEITDPKVQLFGDVAVLTMHYEPSTLEGEPLPPWKVTSVYHRSADEWMLVHAHWSTVENAGAAAEEE